MALLKKQDSTSLKLSRKKFGGKPRDYLGMSSSGISCLRQRFYQFHWVETKKHSARTERIFSLGHLFEQVAIKELKSIGCEVFLRRDEKKIEMFGTPDEQQEEFVDETGHAKGHPDGRISNVFEFPEEELLLELKTMAQSYFLDVKKRGVKKAHPYYYGQAQRYMGMANLKTCMFLAINKNDCKYHIEFIIYNKNEDRDYIRNERAVLFSDSPPEKFYTRDHYKCSAEWCDFEDVCWHDRQPEKNCRTCEFSDLENGGIWRCCYNKKENVKISVEKQRVGCEKYKKGWEL
jgi:hypothetical protein